MAKPHIDIAFLGKRIPQQTLVEYSDDEGTGTVNEDNLNDCINDACEEFYAIISGNFTVPLAEDYPLAKQVIRDIATYNLYLRRHDYEVPEEVSKRYDRAIRRAEKIAEGTLVMYEEAEDDPKYDHVITNKTKADRIFSPDLMKRF